jgi:hypothetical protein
MNFGQLLVTRSITRLSGERNVVHSCRAEVIELALCSAMAYQQTL